MIGSKKMRFRIIVTILFSVLALPNARAVSHDPLFLDEEALRVEITAPFSRLINERPKDRELPGSFSFKGPDGAAPAEEKPSGDANQQEASGNSTHKVRLVAIRENLP